MSIKYKIMQQTMRKGNFHQLNCEKHPGVPPPNLHCGNIWSKIAPPPPEPEIKKEEEQIVQIEPKKQTSKKFVSSLKKGKVNDLVAKRAEQAQLDRVDRAGNDNVPRINPDKLNKMISNMDL